REGARDLRIVAPVQRPFDEIAHHAAQDRAVRAACEIGVRQEIHCANADEPKVRDACFVRPCSQSAALNALARRAAVRKRSLRAEVPTNRRNGPGPGTVPRARRSTWPGQKTLPWS